MKLSALFVIGIVVSVGLSSDALAQRGRGGGGGGGGGGGNRGARGGINASIPQNFIADASKAFRKDIRFAREQRDSLEKIDSSFVKRERELKAEANAIATALPARAAAASAELLTKLTDLQKEFGTAFRLVLVEDQRPIFDHNLGELEKKQEEERQRARGRG